MDDIRLIDGEVATNLVTILRVVIGLPIQPQPARQTRKLVDDPLQRAVTQRRSPPHRERQVRGHRVVSIMLAIERNLQAFAEPQRRIVDDQTD